MINKTITWNYVKDKILSEPKVKVEYDNLTLEFRLAKAIIILKEKVTLAKRLITNFYNHFTTTE